MIPEFSTEIRNVRLGLSTDGFQPFRQSGQQYSSWPVIVTPYNLPPWMCMKEQYMFLTILVPGPRNPKEKLDVFLQPLISELIELWEMGVLTYDVSLKQNFQMRAVLMWTISDFPTYSMLSGWSTAGRLACPHCMDQTDAFTLSQSGKQSWFDNHRKFLPADHVFRRNKKAFRKGKVITTGPPEIKSGHEILSEIENLGLVKVIEEDSEDINKGVTRHFVTGWKKKSIFWDLPYWKDLLIRHNLDVMHIEKNVFDNVFNTVLNVQGRTKDTGKSREELNLYCSRLELKHNEVTGKYPKASYMLDNNEKKILCEWVQKLKFPDGYVSNMSICVDMRKLKMFGMKSHDCHVFMQCILPIAFRELLPQGVWRAITELSLFFKDLTSRNIKSDDMCRLTDNIPITLCKLERIFPPSFFDSMEHLLVHLADEARLAGPVQYRWMYPFERYLRKLKNNVKNKARVEGSICNAYLVEEASTFCSFYFEEHVRTKQRNVPRNCDDGCDGGDDDHPDTLSIFKQDGRPFASMPDRYLDEKEYNAARLYVLLNCAEVTDKYLDLFVDELRAINPSISQVDVETRMERDFPLWFKEYMAPKGRGVRRVLDKVGAGSARARSTDGSIGASVGGILSTRDGVGGSTSSVPGAARGEVGVSITPAGSTSTVPGAARGGAGVSTTPAGSTSAALGAAPVGVGGSTTPTSSNSVPIGGSDTNIPMDSSPALIGGDATSTTRLPSRKTTLTISDGILCPPNKISPAIYKTFKKVPNPVGYCWKLTPNSVKESYWEEFKKVFTWDPALDDMVYEAWHMKAAARYRGFVYGMKKSKKGRPDYITATDWEGWQKYWASEDVKAKSEIAKKCRMSEPDGPGTGQVRHRGGSKSCYQYAMELAAKKGVQPKECLFDAFEYMHRTKEGTYTDEKSRRIAKEIEELAEDLRQPLPGMTEVQDVDMNKCYLEVTGGLDHKGRLFGGGSLAQTIVMSSDSGATSASTSQVDRHTIDTKFQEMEKRLEEEKEERIQLHEQLKAQQKLIQMLMSQSSQSSGHAPAHD